jgi:hypothetical protein
MAENEADSIEFIADCSSWFVKYSKEIGSSTKPVEVSRFLAEIRRSLDVRAFAFFEIDFDVLNSAASGIVAGTKGLGALANAYKKVSAGEGKGAVEKAVKGNELMKPFANAYLFRRVLDELGIDYSLDPDKKEVFGNCGDDAKEANPPRYISSKMHLEGSKTPSNVISFLAKYGKWISIKKMNVRNDTKPEEIAAQLASILLTVDKKMFEYTGIDMNLLDAYVASLGKMRKSAANLEKLVNILDSEEAKAKIKNASRNGSGLEEVSRIYLFRQLLGAMKLNFDLNADELTSVYPNLKIPMPPGRKPKK